MYKNEWKRDIHFCIHRSYCTFAVRMPPRNNNLTINKKTALPSRNYILSHQQIIIVQATNNKGTTRKLDLYHQEMIVLPLPWRCHQERLLVASTSPVTSPSPLSWKKGFVCFFCIFVSVISIWVFGEIWQCFLIYFPFNYL